MLIKILRGSLINIRDSLVLRQIAVDVNVILSSTILNIVLTLIEEYEIYFNASFYPELV